MGTLDRAFLDDLIHFTHLNHVAAVYTLRKTLSTTGDDISELERAAMYALRTYREVPSDEAALQSVRENNDVKRLERIICARIFAELIAALEDLGALGDAIQYRRDKGIFRRYLTSSPGQVAQFFDHVIREDTRSHPNTSLEELLRLPSLASLQGHLTEDLLEAFARSYHIQAQQLRMAANIYRDQDTAPTRLSVSSPALADWEANLNVLLDVGNGSIASPTKSTKKTPTAQTGRNPQSGSVHTRAFNKLKHRSMLTERLPDYVPPDPSEYVEYKPLLGTPPFVDRLFENTIAVAGTMAELAALVQHLDTAGISL